MLDPRAPENMGNFAAIPGEQISFRLRCPIDKHLFDCALHPFFFVFIQQIECVHLPDLFTGISGYLFQIIIPSKNAAVFRDHAERARQLADQYFRKILFV